MKQKGAKTPLWRSAAMAAMLALGACSTPQPQAGRDAPLFVEAYGDISDYHLTPTTPEHLAMTGLQRLVHLDPLLRISRKDRDIVIERNGKSEKVAAPMRSDSADWGVATALALDSAMRLSVPVAAVARDRLEEIVLDGTVSALDPFSHYYRPEIARQRRSERDGYGGIGVTLERSGPAAIATVFPDAPAAAALAVGDRIEAIDDIPTAQLSVEQVAERLRGPVGTSVSLLVRRKDAPAPLTFRMKRAVVVEPTVTLETDDGIAWLQISSFNQKTGLAAAATLRQAHRLLGGRLRGIVLDLRGNPGGLLEQSIEVASLFLDGAPIAQTVGRHPESKQSFVAPLKGAESLPLVVLVNGGSASAAEIVAAALQDAHRATIVGTASFGKGTVQTVMPLANDGELAITWARLIAPGGYALDHHGVIPSVCTAGAAERGWRPHRADAPRATLDEQGWQALRRECPAEKQLADSDRRIVRGILVGAAAPATVRSVEARAP
jgi:carboxyl-terminal processing protease